MQDSDIGFDIELVETCATVPITSSVDPTLNDEISMIERSFSMAPDCFQLGTEERELNLDKCHTSGLEDRDGDKEMQSTALQLTLSSLNLSPSSSELFTDNERFLMHYYSIRVVGFFPALDSP